MFTLMNDTANVINNRRLEPQWTFGAARAQRWRPERVAATTVICRILTAQRTLAPILNLKYYLTLYWLDQDKIVICDYFSFEDLLTRFALPGISWLLFAEKFHLSYQVKLRGNLHRCKNHANECLYLCTVISKVLIFHRRGVRITDVVVTRGINSMHILQNDVVSSVGETSWIFANRKLLYVSILALMYTYVFSFTLKG